MPWVKIDDRIPWHRKFVGIPRAKRTAAIGLYVTALCYCNDQLTDGFLPPAFLDDIPGGHALAQQLVDAGLWRTTGGKYVVHDFLDFQPSAEEVHERRRAEHERKVKGGKARAATAERAGGQFV